MAVKERRSPLQAVKLLREGQSLVKGAAAVADPHCRLEVLPLLLSLTQSRPPPPLLLVIHSVLGMEHDL